MESSYIVVFTRIFTTKYSKCLNCLAYELGNCYIAQTLGIVQIFK